MKSREEYEKSIYAKRDALIMKRKQKITAATSVICVAVCFVTAALFIPKSISNKSDLETTSSTTAPITVHELITENGMSEETAIFDEVGEAEEVQTAEAENIVPSTIVENHIKPATTAAATVKQSSQPIQTMTTTSKTEYYTQKNFGYSETPAEDGTQPTVILTHTEIALETEIRQEESTKSNRPSTTVQPMFNDHAEEKAIDAALTFLTDEQRTKIDPDAHIDVSVTRNADGSEYFTVHFDTAEGAYMVSVDSKTFEFINFRELSYTTASSGEMVSQGYNPNTTNAFAYIPN